MIENMRTILQEKTKGKGKRKSTKTVRQVAGERVT